jgi:hypothetical protein
MMAELRKGLVWALDTRKPEKVAGELEQAKACHVIRIGTQPMSAFVGNGAMTLIVQAIAKEHKGLISETKRYICGLHVLSGGSMLPYDILLTEDLV